MGHPGPRNLSCVSYKHPSVRGGLGGAGGATARTVRCPPGQCCIGIWNQSHALVQGCWGGGGAACPSALCTPSPAGPPGGAVLVCLCRGHLCNGNGSGPGSGPGSAARPAPGGARHGPGLRRARAHRGRPPRGTGPPPEPPSPELPALRFLQVLQRGRFSAVWRGSLRHRPVAIKAFAAGGAERFAAERAVHALPLMEHQNVARLLGARGAGPRAGGGLLVLQLYPAGSLRQFLAQHVGTWAGSVRLALSLARGLAFLHQELWRDGLYKPSVVHRDLSSQNVLVRDDGTCAIGDFGLALALPPRTQGGAAVPRGGPIRKAGTQRYLAPEILDESLDLRAWGRALRQADVYALALLLWEILSRCQALSPGAPVPAFRLAYEAELGASPTGAQLRRLAVDERRRPLIPPAWHRAPQVSPGPHPWGCHGVLMGRGYTRGGAAGAARGLLGPRPRGAALGRARPAAAAAPGAGPRPPPASCRAGPRSERRRKVLELAPPCGTRMQGHRPPTPCTPQTPCAPPHFPGPCSPTSCPPPPHRGGLGTPRFPLGPPPRGPPPPPWGPPRGAPPPPMVPPPHPPPPGHHVPPPRGAPPISIPPPGVPPMYPPVLDKKAEKKMRKKMKKAHKKHKRSSSSSSSSDSD
ncbi:anti-Muellerian hormone type-2 receptor-like [Strigops habroptila]|uniref:anti-Muellerian hormone type-2 receptor-like n=1 Tax=Strigops habroptila TaxID=2489341 RepID=UPI0011CFDD52|nr:anti-Muellerian hormone type-2 receptor-like [Strigops habroptila]